MCDHCDFNPNHLVRIGGGACGGIYTLEKLCGRDVVIVKKPVDADEAKANITLSENGGSKYIPHTYGYCKKANMMVQELVDGVAMDAFMENTNLILNMAFVKEILLGCLKAYQYVWLKGMTHNDTKYQNWMIATDSASDSYKFVLVDFGLTKFVDNPESEEMLTIISDISGMVNELAYKVPEPVTQMDQAINDQFIRVCNKLFSRPKHVKSISDQINIIEQLPVSDQPHIKVDLRAVAAARTSEREELMNKLVDQFGTGTEDVVDGILAGYIAYDRETNEVLF